MTVKKIYGLICTCLAMLLCSCQEIIYVADVDIEDYKEPGEGLDDWATETHTTDGDVNYEVVFAQDKVNRIDIVLTSSEYSSMQSNLATLASQNNGTDFTDSKPNYVACDFYFNDIQWYQVGVRYKGNSSLYSTYNKGNGKLPLRFKFDEFEDDYFEVKDQRFYGFQHLAMSSNYSDDSYMREKSATDLFRAFGVSAVQTAFYEVYVDQGNGTPVYYGLYTMDEVVFDAFLQTEFGSETGNCYKPDEDGAQFSSSGFSLDDFEKKTNEDEGDWSDIQDMYTALHNGTRTTNVEIWKSDLELLFDVQGFLKYLAVNNTIQNWDTYANMSHNYYLYHDPSDDLIKWIVWDNNESFTSGGRYSAVSLGMSGVSSDWPLISYLIDIPEYEEDYKAYLKDFNDNYYMPSEMTNIYDTLSTLISASVANETSSYTTASGSFSSAVSVIKAYCSTRNSVVNSYLD